MRLRIGLDCREIDQHRPAGQVALLQESEVAAVQGFVAIVAQHEEFAGRDHQLSIHGGRPQFLRPSAWQIGGGRCRKIVAEIVGETGAVGCVRLVERRSVYDELFVT